MNNVQHKAVADGAAEGDQQWEWLVMCFLVGPEQQRVEFNPRPIRRRGLQLAVTRHPGDPSTGQDTTWDMAVSGLTGFELCAITLMMALTISCVTVFGQFRN